MPFQSPAMVFNLSPYNGDIDPNTNEGLKLVYKATEERKDDLKLKISQENTKNIMAIFESNTCKFGWGSLVHIVPINDIRDTKLIIKQYNETRIKFHNMLKILEYLMLSHTI